MTAKPYQHPRLKKSKVGFATNADHMRVVHGWDVAYARRAAREKKLKEEEDYPEKRNERLWVMVAPEGRERPSKTCNTRPAGTPCSTAKTRQRALSMPWSSPRC
jgi:hypothetical protein